MPVRPGAVQGKMVKINTDNAGYVAGCPARHSSIIEYHQQMLDTAASTWLEILFNMLNFIVINV